MLSAWTAALAVRTARLFAAAAGNAAVTLSRCFAIHAGLLLPNFNAAVQNLVQKSCVSAEHRIGKPVLYPAELRGRMSSHCQFY